MTQCPLPTLTMVVRRYAALHPAEGVCLNRIRDMEHFITAVITRACLDDGCTGLGLTSDPPDGASVRYVWGQGQQTLPDPRTQAVNTIAKVRTLKLDASGARTPPRWMLHCNSVLYCFSRTWSRSIPQWKYIVELNSEKTRIWWNDRQGANIISMYCAAEFRACNLWKIYAGEESGLGNWCTNSSTLTRVKLVMMLSIQPIPWEFINYRNIEKQTQKRHVFRRPRNFSQHAIS